MERRRVWLHTWEWGCCGDPFAVGDTVTLSVDRPVEAWFPENIGSELSASIDAVESHHEDGGAEEMTGLVVGICGVALRYTERRVPRPPRPDGVEGPAPVFAGQGFWAVAPNPAPYVIVSELVPGSARLVEVPRVPWPPRESEVEHEGQETPSGLTGYLVDLEIR